jgi:uncharacterized Tic20 family protein
MHARTEHAGAPDHSLVHRAVDFYVEVFSWLLPAVFIVGPLIGWGVDKAGTHTHSRS